MASATQDNETCHTRSPLLNPLVEQLANRLSPQADKSLVIPQAGEEANVSLPAVPADYGRIRHSPEFQH
ncbi:MAG: hypothetical protein Q7J38_16400 [Gallionella sp.]|nr:hypothetical protein [Gallionella sp.]